jgi:hypothetical protein
VLGANFQGAAVAEIDAHQCGTIMSSGAVSDRDCTESDIRWLKRNADLLPR